MSTGTPKNSLTLSARAPRQGGLSLVELMIGLLLSVIVVGALAELFVNITRSNQELAKTNSQIENARFAMTFVKNDIIHAGYFAGFVPEFDDLGFQEDPGDVPPNPLPDPCRPFSEWDNPVTEAAAYEAHRNYLLGIAVEVRDAMPADCAATLTDKADDTDVLVVRHANTCVGGDANCEAVNDEDLYLQTSNCNSDTERYLLDPNAPDMDLLQRNCTDVQPSRKFIQNIYYVRDWTHATDDGIPSLVRSRFEFGDSGPLGHQAPQVLVEGIERFRVEVGIDNVSDSGDTVDYTSYTTAIAWADETEWYTPTNRGDGIPDGAYVHCGAACSVDQLLNVVAIRVYLLARARQPTPGYVDTKDYILGGVTVDADDLDDEYKRHVFSSTLRLVNVSGRRETPFDPNEASP